MYRISVNVPYISHEMVAKALAAIPNLGEVVSIPVIISEKAAIDVATEKAKNSMPVWGSEFVDRMENITYDETKRMWVATFVCLGD